MSWQVLLTSTVVSAIIGALAGWVSSRSLARLQAKLNYDSTARLRLYEAIGPLRFQLLLACRDVERRVSLHLEGGPWDMNPAGYFARSFIFRILRPLALIILVERQTRYADFAVDESSLDLIKFETAASRILVDDDPLPYYDGLDWVMQTQHVFRDNLRKAAAKLLNVDSAGKTYVIDGAEFDSKWPDPLADPDLEPLARLFANCDGWITKNPVFWCRLVGFAYVCSWYIGTHGRNLGFAARPIDAANLLRRVDDPQILDHVAEYPQIFEAILAKPL